MSQTSTLISNTPHPHHNTPTLHPYDSLRLLGGGDLDTLLLYLLLRSLGAFPFGLSSPLLLGGGESDSLLRLGGEDESLRLLGGDPLPARAVRGGGDGDRDTLGLPRRRGGGERDLETELESRPRLRGGGLRERLEE
ncbi:hypothetical protein GRF29_1g3295535 [Pseudopithomyces chartarum]|uniref:Uncharacterized protein n=1 Tax=Pseudopithomyces chartarum TaxID=1892770 RepID=A0AAN6M943_9PLEO|nr:hypothetical protein GRF29_1g3295535 [Pseudopithomyces chartarum]